MIKIYQYFISPLIGPSCRYYPSCSCYSYGCFHKFGVIKGFLLTIKRISGCHPFSRGGYDPIPSKFQIFFKLNSIKSFFGEKS